MVAAKRMDMLTFGIGLVFFLIMFVTFTSSSSSRQSSSMMSSIMPSMSNANATAGPVIPRPNTFFTNQEGDTLTNPYAPPLKDVFFNGATSGARCTSCIGGGGGGIPINMATSSSANVNTSYQQIGLLTKAESRGSKSAGSSSSTGTSSDPVIMPLMGKPLFTNRDKWLFYAISDKNNAMKLPIIIKGRNALSEIGVDNVYTGDTVYVQGYNDEFKVTLYENATPQYIPFI
jgi:hypothetical protein